MAASSLLAASPSSAGPGDNELISYGPGGERFTGLSFAVDTSADGQRTVLYGLTSSSSQPVFINNFLRDGTTTLQLTSGPGTNQIGISDNGRWVAMVNQGAVTLTDLDTGQTQAIASADISGSGVVDVSDDGLTVAFDTPTGVLPTDTDGEIDVYVWHGGPSPSIELVTNAASAAGEQSRVSALTPDGRYVLFTSNDRSLVPGDDTLTFYQGLYLHDLVSHVTTIESRYNADVGGGVLPSGVINNGDITDDGQTIVFTTQDDVVGANPGPSWVTMYVRDRSTGNARLLTTSANGTPAYMVNPSIDGAGNFVAVDTYWNALVGTGQPNAPQIAVVKVDTGQYQLASKSFADPASEADGQSSRAIISADGHFVVYTSYATDLLATAQPPNTPTAYRYEVQEPPPLDDVPPTVSGTLSPAANAAGWSNTAGSVIEWSATDPDPSSGPGTFTIADTPVDTEGTVVYTSPQVCDLQGNCSAGTLEVRLDLTPPAVSITGVADGDVVPVQPTLDCVASDAVSGLDGTCTVDVLEGPTGVFTVTATAVDIAGNTATTALIYTVVPPASAPIAVDDTAATSVGAVIDIDVLGNDTDADDDIDETTLTVVVAPVRGTAVVDVTPAGASIGYTATTAGTDTLVYQICDDTGLCDTATVTITNVAASQCTITGTAGNDTLTGTNGDDVICGLAGTDTIDGRGGNDIILGGSGDDSINGGAGKDTVNGNAGDDTIVGGAGSDVLDGDRGNDVIDGNAGDDTLIGGDGDDVIGGGIGNDELRGGGGADTLNGGADNDTLNGGADGDTLNGDNGDDVLRGGDGDDTVNGNGGNDTLRGGPGTDTGNGGPGVDTSRGVESVTNVEN